MKRVSNVKKKRATKRDLFAELTEGVEALAAFAQRKAHASHPFRGVQAGT